MKVRILLDKRKAMANSAGEFPVMVKISMHGRPVMVWVGVRLGAHQWREGQVVNHPLAERLNIMLGRYMLHVQEALLEWREAGELQRLPADEIRRRVRCIINGEDYRPQKKGTRFTGHFEDVAQRHKGRTRDMYLYTLKRIRAWDAGADAMVMEDVTVEWLSRFDAHLALTAPNANSRSVHMRNIRAVMNDAITRELTVNYPFRRFKVKSQPTKHRALTVEELRRLWGSAVHPHERDYLDMFKLMFLLCGISPVDMFKLEGMRGGRVITSRSKTGQPVDVKVEPEALEIIERHRGSAHLVDVLDRHKDYRNYLHKMGQALKSMGGVTYDYRKTRDGKHRVVAVRRITWPELSPYWARHTWASIAYSIGVSIDVIGQALGHSQRGVTEIYIAKDRSRVDEANRRVIDWVLHGTR